MAAQLIICYHGVSSTWSNPTTVSERLLERQLWHLRRRGYVGVTVGELVERRRSGRLPPRAVAITFDDGYASTLRAKPLLDAVAYPATVFVVTSFAESGELLSWPGIDHWTTGEFAEEMRPLTWSQLDELAAAGWEVGSHTVTHPYLPALDDAALERELVPSRDAIARRLGRCDTLAYPYGAADDRVVAAVRAAGYSAACVVSPTSRRVDDLRLPRVGLYGRDESIRLWMKLSRIRGAVSRGRRAAGGALPVRAPPGTPR